MKRRDFISLVGGAAAWPLAARAQQPGKLPTIGYLGSGTSATQGQWVAALVRRLHELGWSEGRNLTIEHRWADGRTDYLAGQAAELVSRKVDVMVITGTPPAMTVKHATSTIPIVFVGIGDPVSTGVVKSLARPGGNATGLSQQATDTGGKRLELLREAVGGLRRVAVLVNVGNPYIPLEMKELELAAGNLGLELVMVDIRRVEDIVPALIAIRGQVQALYVPGDPLIFTHRVRVITVALAGRLPTIHNFREHVDAGGLMSYGPSFVDLFHRSADYVDKILRGTKPADIPVEQPTKFDLIINLVTARSLGIEIPPSLLARADEDRMSNCVVGSGGSRLPCSTIAEHRVEGCDHCSHDGDDDDLGFFVGVGEAIVEGFEGGTVSARAEGGHVEDITDRHPTTVDAAVSLKLAAVEVIGCEADEGGDLFAAHLPEFWEHGDEREGQHGADAWHRGQQLIALSESKIGGNHLGQALVEEADIG